MRKSLILALAASALLAGCAGALQRHDGMSTQAPPRAGMRGPMMAGGMPMDSYMQQFQQKMMAAGTPAEREALMQEHRREMQSMMSMMECRGMPAR